TIDATVREFSGAGFMATALPAASAPSNCAAGPAMGDVRGASASTSGTGTKEVLRASAIASACVAAASASEIASVTSASASTVVSPVSTTAQTASSVLAWASASA